MYISHHIFKMFCKLAAAVNLRASPVAEREAPSSKKKKKKAKQTSKTEEK